MAARENKGQQQEHTVHLLEGVVVSLVLHDGVGRQIKHTLECVSDASGGGRVLCRPVPH